MSSTDRLRELDNIEKELQNVLQSGAYAITELSKEKPTIKQVELHSNSFLKSLQLVESGISKQLLYLNQSSTGQAHEGSCYASQKVLNMAWHRLEHARLRLNDSERLRLQQMQQNSILNVPRQNPATQQPQQATFQQQQQPLPPPPPVQQQQQH